MPSLFVSDIGKGRLTVGKIYGGLLILENWKSSKFGNGPIHSVSHGVCMSEGFAEIRHFRKCLSLSLSGNIYNILVLSFDLEFGKNIRPSFNFGLFEVGSFIIYVLYLKAI